MRVRFIRLLVPFLLLAAAAVFKDDVVEAIDWAFGLGIVFTVAEMTSSFLVRVILWALSASAFIAIGALLWRRSARLPLAPTLGGICALVTAGFL